MGVWPGLLAGGPLIHYPPSSTVIGRLVKVKYRLVKVNYRLDKVSHRLAKVNDRLVKVNHCLVKSTTKVCLGDGQTETYRKDMGMTGLVSV